MATAPKKTASGSEDAYRELIHEVRNLSAAVALLHTIFVKRTVLYWLLGIETALVVVALTVAGIFIGIEHSNTNDLVNKLTDTCMVRNQQTDATKNYLASTVRIQAEAQHLNAVLLGKLSVHFSPAESAEAAKIQTDYLRTLNAYFKAQPADIPCKTFRGGG
jgi:hypothetical protein